MKTPSRAKNGLGVDSRGGPVIDPTENVIALVSANKERADDLRKADKELTQEKIKGIRREANLRMYHNKEMRKSESDRLNAIRQVDVAARAEDRKTALDAIQALALQTQSNRDTLSKQVSDTAETLSKQNAEANKQQLDRIAALEKTSYTGAGEKSVSDPALVALAESVSKLAQASATGSGERRGASTAVLGMKDLILFAIAVGAGIVAFLK